MALPLAGVIVLLVAGGAFAFFAATGSGTGATAVGSPSPWSVATGSPTGGPLFPGSGTEHIAYTVTNTDVGHQQLSGTSALIASYKGSIAADLGDVTQNGSPVPDCLASWFTAVNTPPEGLPLDLAGGADVTGSVAVMMQDSATDQDACEGVSPDVTTTVRVVPTPSALASTISTVAGSGTAGYSGDGSAASSAEINSPFSAAVDSGGDTLINDRLNYRVRLVAAASCASSCPYGLSSMTKGDIYTVAGNGTAGYSGDGGPATSAEISSATSVAVDPEDNLLIADRVNQRVRLVAAVSCAGGCPYGLSSMTKGDIYTVAGNGTAGYAGDGGPAISAELNYPEGVAADVRGDLLIDDRSNDRVRLVAAASCSSSCPYGLSSMTKGEIYTIAGNGAAADSGDGGAASSAALDSPSALAVDPESDLLITENVGDRVRLVAAVSCSSSCPYGLSSMTKGDIYTVAGSGTAGYSGDGGPATGAEINDPFGAVAVDPSGDLLIPDYSNDRVRLVAAASCSSSCAYGLSSMTKGDIYTVAGSGTAGYAGDGGPATSAEINNPGGLAVDSAGNLLITDYANNRVRMVAW